MDLNNISLKRQTDMFNELVCLSLLTDVVFMFGCVCRPSDVLLIAVLV